MTIFAETIVSGIAAGAVYVLIALGFSLIYRTSRVINFAQGDLAMLGAYIAYSAHSAGLPLGLAMLVGVLAIGALAAVAERVILRPLYGRPLVVAILATVALAVAIEGAIQLIWGSQPLSLPSLVSQSPWHVAGVAITPTDAAIFGIAFAVVLPLLWFIGATRTGRAMRGCAQDREVVTLFGVNPARMYSVSFILGGLLAGLAGVLIAPTVGLTSSGGLDLSAVGFSAAVLGGLGSLPGAIVGGVLISVVVNLAAVYVSSGYSNGFAYLLMMLVLLIRVRGLMGDDIEAVRQV